jgi:uncharacterized protein YciI
LIAATAEEIRMFVIFLRFTGDRSQAGRLAEGHNAWIRRGFDDGVFLVVGSLPLNAGGGIMAHNTSRVALEDRLAADPLVAERVVSAEIIEITPARADERLKFLLG